MQARITKISFDEETGLTEAVLSTPYGTFVGYAQYNKDEEKFKPSVFVGDNLAEARAYIAAYNEALQRKREQRKGIKRLMYSCGGSKEAYKYANKVMKSIEMEISDLIEERQTYKDKIEHTLNAKGIHDRSLSTDKKAKEDYMRRIREGIAALGQLNSKTK